MLSPLEEQHHNELFIQGKYKFFSRDQPLSSFTTKAKVPSRVFNFVIAPHSRLVIPPQYAQRKE